jgi:hypothetical protein
MEPPKKITIHLNPETNYNEVVKHRVKGPVYARMKKVDEKMVTTQEEISTDQPCKNFSGKLVAHGFLQLVKTMFRSRTYLSWVGLYQRNMAILMR